MEKIQNYIGGEFCSPSQNKYLDNIDPARGVVYSQVPDSEAPDVKQAIEAAARAFPSWSSKTPQERASYLRAMAKKIRERLDELAEIESRDNGKPIKLAMNVDIPRSATNLEFFADAITQFHGESFQTSNSIQNTTHYSPLGVVSCISPWNLPLYLLTWKIAPALASGNTVVAKPSEVTPMSAYYLSQIAQEVGLPAGVLNIVHGLGPKLGETLTTNEKVQAVSFTGSTTTGKIIASQAAQNFKKYSLEMGGKNPNIIFADADLKKAIGTSVHSSFANQGQICLCGSRIFVERPIYEQFKQGLVDKIAKTKIGNPLDQATQHGALVSKEQYEKVRSYIELAKKDGATLLTGERELNLPEELSNGYFIAPTLIEGLSHEHPLNQEEIFGPVATLIPFDSQEEVLTMANSTRYGLSASIWTSDMNRAHQVARDIEAGIVWVNCWMVRDLRTPFGGVKDSGVGREGGQEALKFFTEVKNICINFDSK